MAVDLAKQYSLGEFELEPDKLRLTRDGARVHLTRKPFQVLLYLIEHRERMVTRKELLEAFWQGHDVYDETLTKCVGAIRKALDDQGDQPRFIITHWAEGYRYIGPTEEVATTPPSLVAVEKTRAVRVLVEDSQPLQVGGAMLAEPKMLRAEPRYFSRVWLFAMALVLIGITLAAILVYRRRATPAPTVTSIRSLAVLPIRNLSGDPTNEYFSDGITETLISSLSKIDGLKVVARSAVFRFKNNEAKPQDIGRELGVMGVLEGSVRKLGDSVRIDLRLVSVEDGRVLWTSDEHDHAMGDLFALQDDIARKVAAALRLQLTPDAEEKWLAHRYSDNVEAYQLYLHGRQLYNDFSTEQDLQRAIDYFQAAIAKDPNYALAYTGLADTYMTYAVNMRDPKEVMPKALSAAQKALELDNSLAEAHYSRGAIAFIYEWDWPKAKAELERSLELDAKSVEANACYLHSAVVTEPTADALTMVRRALDQNPVSLFVFSELSCGDYYARRFDQAVDISRQTKQMDARYLFAYYNAARAMGQKQMYEQAISEMNEAIAIGGRQPYLLAELGYNYAASGRKDEARRLLDELATRSAKEFVDPYPLAFVYCALGDKDKALSSLEKAYEARSTWMPWIKVEPKFDSLRSEPRYAALLSRLGFPKAS